MRKEKKTKKNFIKNNCQYVSILLTPSPPAPLGPTGPPGTPTGPPGTPELT